MPQNLELKALKDLKKFNHWRDGLNEGDRALLAQYIAIRKNEGASFFDILTELIAHLPQIIEFITAIISLFKATGGDPASLKVAPR